MFDERAHSILEAIRRFCIFVWTNILPVALERAYYPFKDVRSLTALHGRI